MIFLRNVHRAKSGFTLLELLLSLALSGLIGVAVILMLGAAASGAAEESDTRRSNLRRQIATVRLRSLTRTAVMVLHSSSNRILLWKNDSTGNALPDLSELRLLEWSSSDGEVRLYEAPAGFSPASDHSYALTTNFAVIAATAASTFSRQTILQHVTAWNTQLDASSVQAARRIRIGFTILNESGSDSAALTSSLRGFP